MGADITVMMTYLMLGLLSVGCSSTPPRKLLSRDTTCGEIRYLHHAPESRATQRVIIAHGFLRSPETMDYLSTALAKAGCETASIDLKRSKPWNGRHAENAQDMIALRQSLGWESVVYAGFSAGGLSALLAAADDPACHGVLLLDPVEHGKLGINAAARVKVPVLAILGQPGPGNAQGNAAPMLAAIPQARTIEIKSATHCDFETSPSIACHLITGSKPDKARTADVHAAVIKEAVKFIQNLPKLP